MKGDFSRHDVHAASTYSRVRLQQGRALVDADLNEQFDQILEAQRHFLRKALGPHGYLGVNEDNDFEVKQQLVNNKLRVTLDPGTYFVDGLTCHYPRNLTDPPKYEIAHEKIEDTLADTDRCLIFEYNEENSKLDLLYSAGIAESNTKKMKFKLNPAFYQKLKEDIKILWIRNKSDIPDQQLYKIAQSLNSTSFIIGSLTGYSSIRDATSILKSIASVC